MKRSIVHAVLLSSLLLAPVQAAVVATTGTAQAATAEATEFLKTKHALLVKLLGQPASAERDKKIDAELAGLIDYDEISKVALGDQWDKRSAPERDKFRNLLRQLIEKGYRKNLNRTLDYEIKYLSETPEGSDVRVSTEAHNTKDKREAPVTIDYRLRKRANGYIVVDLLPEQSSMARTYNKEFSKVIQKDGWEGLLKKMEDKLAKS